MMPEARVAEPIADAEAAHLARNIYGIEATAQRLPGEYDDNFHLTATGGEEFVLKVMHPAREASFVEMQCRALEHLARRAPQLPLPRVKPSANGASHCVTQLPSGSKRLVWMLSYLPGTPLAKVHPHPPELLRSLGQFLGDLDSALADFAHPAAHRELKWDLSKALWVRESLGRIHDRQKRELVEKFLLLYEAEALPTLASLRRSIVYGDANDYNVLVSAPWPQPRKIAGIIDFGDMHFGLTVSEVAVAAAYAILGKREPLAAAKEVVAGYHKAFALSESELGVLYVLIGMRLAVSVVNSAQRKTLVPDDPYVTISEAPAWEALERWARVHPRFAHYRFRDACGLRAVPQSKEMERRLTDAAPSAASLFDVDLRTRPCVVFDLSVRSRFLGADPKASETSALTRAISTALQDANAAIGIGRYNEARLLYTSTLFGEKDDSAGERRTIHLGMDFFAPPGTPVHAPLDGMVHATAINRAHLDYGPLVILRHSMASGQEFFTLYGHLSEESLRSLRPGQSIARGQQFAQIGTIDENGGWPPHLHFQIILDLLELQNDFPGVARASERGVWTSLSPDPNLLLAIPEGQFPPTDWNAEETLARRHLALGKNLSVSYDRPLKIVRGWMQHLYDEAGRAYLDAYNNVPLVGHSHPRIVKAVQDELALLNTNTRYLHDNVVQYAERLTKLLPSPLRVCYFLNSGSEANELAIRLARAHTRRDGIIVLEHAYHGHTSTLIDVSPYKFNGPGGTGRKPWVHVAPIPDDYRGRYRRGDAEAGKKYAGHVARIIEDARASANGIAAFLAETLPSVAGQIVFPRGYLTEAYQHVRAAGGVCIADEVQTGFGRLGAHFWGFETQGVVPDVVVLGKPIGNGFPLAAVITTPEIAASFENGMEFFSTYGGNPVSCAAGLAVLDVLEGEGLQKNAKEVGGYMVAQLESLQAKHALIGDVRGSGLFLGLDLVLDRGTREPAPAQAAYIVNRLRERGVLTGTDGPHHNVIKLRPPLVFARSDADLFVNTLDEILGEDPAQPGQ
ncbi:MAG TPA: aminotransferase class III-fold pyridoxal phosphate-dependent enzyme [Candidatus Acidoferrum sp.]|nr:aminotransferase class III-fold pyridoxal phosphate-dependent enzyme [Candidatus Acidoferrum sp.]